MMREWIPLPKRLPLTEEAQKRLRDLAITENGPGTVLHDFEAVLGMFKDGQLLLTPARQLPLAKIAELNERLSHPIRHNLRRLHPKSFPPIQGLYLLLRASGFTLVEGTPAKPVLKLSDDGLRQWEALNPAERYGTLLEAWLLRGYPEILGDRSGMMDLLPQNFDRSAMFYTEIPEQGLTFPNRRELDSLMSYDPERHNLGLLMLFGLITIEDEPPLPGGAWNIQSIKRTPYGDALLALLVHEFFGRFPDLPSLLFQPQEDVKQAMQQLEQAPDPTPFGALQKVLRPYWPAFKRTLELREWSFREGTYTFKASLGPIWRRIEINARETLDRLAALVIHSVDFDMDHLYSFTIQTSFGFPVDIGHRALGGPVSTDMTRVGDLPVPIGQQIDFVYDFGDNWEFTLLLENVDGKKRKSRPAILEKHGEPPKQYANWDGDEYDEEDWDDGDILPLDDPS